MVADFADGQQLAMKSLERIAAMLGASAQDVITPLRITVRDLKTSFESLVNEQKSLGYDDSQGITAELTAASSAVERIIHEDLSWVADGDARKMLMSLLTMRRDELAYRLTRSRALGEALPRRSQELQRAVRVGRRRAVDEAEAERGSEDL